MTEIDISAATNDENSSIPVIARFGQLPTGVQRLIIAIIFVIVLVVAVVLRQMIQTEESVRHHEEGIPLPPAPASS